MRAKYAKRHPLALRGRLTKPTSRSRSRIRRHRNPETRVIRWAKSYGFPTAYRALVRGVQVDIVMVAGQRAESRPGKPPYDPPGYELIIADKPSGMFGSVKEAMAEIDLRLASRAEKERAAAATAKMGDVLTTHDPNVPVIAEAGRKWSDYQQDIFDFVRYGKGNAIIEAVAGSGKTTVVVESLNHIPRGKDVLVLAFNSSIAKELEGRVPRSLGVAISTFSGFGFGMLRPHWKTPFVSKERSIARDEAVIRNALPQEDRYRLMGQRGWKVFHHALTRLVGLCQSYLASSKKDITAIQNDHDILVDEVTGSAENWKYLAPNAGVVPGKLYTHDDVVRFVQSALQGQLTEPKEGGSISYRDMVYVPAMNPTWSSRTLYDFIFVDETQDTDVSQLSLVMRAAKPGARIICVGDRRQCHPAGVLVRVPGGRDVPIEALASGDMVVPWTRKSQRAVGQQPATVASRPFDGELCDVIVEGHEAIVPMTLNHKVLARWTDRTSSICVTYLMYRRGFGYRVGWCKLFTSAGIGHNGFHLGHRARIEQADAAWVLRASTDRTDASVYESIVAAKYGLPTATFEAVRGTTHQTAEAIRQIFDAVGDENEERGVRALRDHGLDESLALYPWPKHSDDTAPVGRRATYFPVYAANIIPGLMALPMGDGVNEWRVVKSAARRHYAGPVYSLDVAVSHNYVANGVVVLNSINRFRGADDEAIPRMIDRLNAVLLPLSVSYRVTGCAAAEARKIVKGFQTEGDVPGGDPTPPGICEQITANRMTQSWQAGDIVISRINSVLVPLALKAFRQGHQPFIMGEGDEIQKMLGRAVNDTIKLMGNNRGIDAFVKRLDNWKAIEQKKVTSAILYRRRNWTFAEGMLPEDVAEARAEGIEDDVQYRMVETIREAFYNDDDSGIAQMPNIKDVDDVFDFLDKMAPSEEALDKMTPEDLQKLRENRIIFTSAHRIKGGEGRRIFLLEETFTQRRDGIHSKRRLKPKEKIQEENLWYVAVTRVKHERANPKRGLPARDGELYYVKGLESAVGDFGKEK